MSQDFTKAGILHRRRSTAQPYSIRTEGHHYLAEIIYSYSVNGEYYSGFLQHAAFAHKNAERFADKFPAGMMLVVRFNPAKPEVSVARLDDRPGYLP